ncbi:T6SS immunity protein Tli4 family protein [Pseudomonas sp. Irchel 3A5]|uniref:T6SS immunity protein Tli4 family protein n=1 Tax=Pseudomonas sp. Irchel 3A5 TaxID=2008911 RepID=UPI0021148067|nr:T6SS immunity protein Tli4 family protein [Pseudomonas sp. Irchel 3A5]
MKSFLTLKKVVGCMIVFSVFYPQLSLALPTDGNKAINDQWITHYFGRFQLDIPAGSEIAADYKLYNEKVDLISTNGKSDLNSIVDQKIEELKKGIAHGTSSRYEKTIPLSNGSVLILSRLDKLYTFHAYLLTSQNTLYNMLVKSISAKGIEGAINKTRLISESLFSRPPQDAPPRGAFALEEGYTTLGAAQSLEGVYMGAQISTHPGTFVSLLTQRIAEHDDSLMTRFEEENGGVVSGMGDLLTRTKTLRKRTRRVGDIEAEEVAVATSIDGKRFYTFQLEYEGQLKSNTRPFIDLRLGTHEVGSDFKTDEEALAFWDKLVGSLKALR